jgi:hypothetical protein
MRSILWTAIKLALTGLILLLLNGCNVPFMPSVGFANPVELKPLLDLNIPQDAKTLREIMDFNVLTKSFGRIYPSNSLKSLDFEFHYVNVQKRSTDIQALIGLHDTEEKAAEWVKTICKVPVTTGYAVVQEGKKGMISQYCLPFLTQARTGPDGLYVDYKNWYYYGFVIQKGRLTFTFDEKTETKDRTAINEVIQGIVEAIKTQVPQ